MDHRLATAPSGVAIGIGRSTNEQWLHDSIEQDAPGCYRAPMQPCVHPIQNALFYEHYHLTDPLRENGIVHAFPSQFEETIPRQGQFIPANRPWAQVDGSSDGSERFSPYSGSSFDEIQSPPYTSTLFAGGDYPFHYTGSGTLAGDAEEVHSGTCGENASFVAPYEVQFAVDENSEQVTFDDERAGYEVPQYVQLAHEGYQPLETSNDIKEEAPTPALTADQASPGFSERSHASPNLRRRRLATELSRDRSQREFRVTKRSAGNRQPSSHHRPFSSGTSDPIRPFACPFAIYGCTVSFGSKNEWKRHIKIQHMRFSFWRCDQCDENDSPNDFNRKDLFTSHIRRMHPIEVRRQNKGRRVSKSEQEEEILNAAATRCYITVRTPPARTQCLFCDVEFDGANLWNDRLEHIGRHMEAMKKEDEKFIPQSHWNEDEYMHEWLVNEHLIVHSDTDGWRLI